MSCVPPPTRVRLSPYPAHTAELDGTLSLHSLHNRERGISPHRLFTSVTLYSTLLVGDYFADSVVAESREGLGEVMVVVVVMARGTTREQTAHS